MTRPAHTPHRSLRRHVLAGATAVALLVGGVGGWAATSELSGAVIASGLLVVDSNVKKVQHPSGGVIGELRVRDGDRVKAGDLLVRLDETLTRASLAIVVKTLTELLTRQGRLEAERDGSEAITFAEELTGRAGNPDVARVITGEKKLFELRKTARRGQEAQLRERIVQLREEIVGLTGQADAKKHEIELIRRELEGVRELWDKKLVPISRLTALEREAARLEGERGRLIAAIAQTKGKITETELQIIQIDQNLRSEVARELREIQAKMAESVEQKVAAEDQLKRTEIRAPQAGIVHQMSVHTIGGVIKAGEPIMLIVPESDELVVEARIPPQSIDQLGLGQSATLRFAAFNQRTTPELEGSVIHIAADLIRDQESGEGYYVARIGIPPAEIARLERLKLLAGMPVEVFIQTDARTVLSYLVKPLHDQITKAFRER
ncbi:MAG: HlyD family type I secretion periplasmic adaptor subunit [Rhodospirillales bacterium]|nr:HlyD family type I secretion periplasmic adaptor subunit [Rhodospirillales bacterium]